MGSPILEWGDPIFEIERLLQPSGITWGNPNRGTFRHMKPNRNVGHNDLKNVNVNLENGNKAFNQNEKKSWPYRKNGKVFNNKTNEKRF